MKMPSPVVSSLAALMLLGACAAAPAAAPAVAPAEPLPPAPVQAETSPAPAPAPAPALATPRTLEVPLEARSGSKLAGKATLTETEGGVHVVLVLEGVEPGGHGSHVHEKGDCSAPDAASAGGHFNPKSHDHGLPSAEHRHLGDLGNISIGKDGKGTHDITVAGANLKPEDAASFIGRAIIVHAKKDDGGQPVGNAGARIGCGVIKG